MERQYDAIVIGAGPAGSSAAILLARAGWHVALIEKKPFPRRKVCGECIAASNLPLLDALGIGKDFAALAGPPLRRVALMAGERIIHAELPPYDHPAHRWGVALGREHLDTLLLSEAHACGVQVHQPWVARGITGGPGNFRCVIEHADLKNRLPVSAPVLIDAHGSWEPLSVDERAGRERHRPSDLFAFKANFTNAALEPGMLPVLAFPGGYGGMVIADHATMTLAFCMRRDAMAACRPEMHEATAAEAAVAHVMRSCRGVREAVAGASHSGAWLAVGPLRPGIRLLPRRSGMSGVFRIGNAAGEAHPIIGEGMSMAIQSAWLLADRLAPVRERCSDKDFLISLQEDYARAWRRQFAPRIRLAALFAHAAMRPALAGHALPLLQRFPQILTMAARWSGKIRCVPVEQTDIYNLALQGDRAA